MSGFGVLDRSTREHPLFAKDVARLGAWTWLILTACWKPTPFDIKGRTITLQRGQLSASVRQLAEAWGWSKSAVDRFLTRLETETMIEREAGHGRMVITICNYGKYQDLERRKRDSSGTQAGTRAGQQRDTKEPENQLPLSNDNGGQSDPSRVFWDGAKGYLGKSKASLIGKWANDYGQAAVAEAITEAMLVSPQPADRVAYVGGILRKSVRAKANAGEIW